MAKPVRKKKRQVDAEGVAHIKATFNNTIITISTMNGDTVAWASAGAAVTNEPAMAESSQRAATFDVADEQAKRFLVNNGFSFRLVMSSPLRLLLTICGA